jgi:cell fate (sporulation/competence/biofilm development) regulator YmcA (YheA/YmcA/DUF963 family)
MSNELKKIFETQKNFQRHFYNPDKISHEDKIKYTKETILSVHGELSEILSTLDWKTHRREEKKFNEDETIEEIIDAFKYLLNLCVIWNIDVEKFINEFYRKSKIVDERYEKEIKI